MRKAWITLAALILFAGIAVGYVRSRRGHPDVVSPPTVVGSEAASAPSPPMDSPQPQPAQTDTHPDEARAVSTSETHAERAEAVARGTLGEPSRTIERSGGAASPPAPAPAPTPVGSSTASATQPPAPVAPPPGAAPPAPLPNRTDAKPTTVDDPESDRRAPVLQSLRFDPPEIQNGGTAILTITATDDLSGVKSAVGMLRSPSETAEVPFVARDAGGNGVFTATIAISHQAETGYWFVSSVQLVDKADNPMNVSFTKTTVPGGGALHVVSEQSDSKAPEVHRVFIEKASVGGGENNRIVIDVDDDSSGVASVSGMFQSPSKAAYINFCCAPTAEGAWASDVLVPANADCGPWILWQLRVADKANNRAVLAVDSPQLERASFVVSGGGDCDSEPPVLDTIFVAPEVVSNSTNTEVVLTFTAHDDASGVGGLIGRVDGPIPATGRPPSIFFSAPPGTKFTDAPIVVRISVPQHASQGIWRVALLQLTDHARNTRSYQLNDPAIANAFFTVE